MVRFNVGISRSRVSRTRPMVSMVMVRHRV